MLLYTPLARVLRAQCSVIPPRYALKVQTHTQQKHTGACTPNILIKDVVIWWPERPLLPKVISKDGAEREEPVSRGEGTSEEACRPRRDRKRELKRRDVGMRVWGKGGTSRQGEKKGRGMKDRYSRQADVSRVRLLSIRTWGSDRSWRT